jgi:nucleoside-diphosphate-sugar epimerase
VDKLNATGFVPSFNFEEGLRQTIEFYTNNR